MNGPTIRTDVIDVYVFRREPTPEVLQLRRARAPFLGDWHPVMGHIEPGETAEAAALRELREEIGLALDDRAFVALYQLEQTFPFFLADRNEIMLSPRFAAEVRRKFVPTLNPEHDGHRWVALVEPARFIWPGQRHALAELASAILPGGATAEALTLRRGTTGRP